MNTKLINWLKVFAVVLPILILSSCVNDETDVSDYASDTEDITFSLQLPGANKPSSRALSATDENNVTEIDVLVFKPGGGDYVRTAICNSAAITTDPGDSRMKTFVVTLPQGTFDLVVLANSRSVVNAASLKGLNKADALATLKVAMPSGGKWIASAGASDYKPIPMWGEKNSVVINENTNLTGSNRILLTRAVAKVNVQISASNFTLTSVDVYNYNTQGFLHPDASAWDVSTPTAPKATAPHVPSTSSIVETPIGYNNNGGKTEINTTTNKCTDEIYIFEAENHTGSGHSTPKDLRSRTCLVVGGIYGSDATPTYYRVDFSSGSGVSQSYMDVLRNHQYIIDVTSVSGPGYEDSFTAYTAGPVNIQAEVLQWNDGNAGDVIFDGQHYLSIKPEMVFNFQKDADADVVRVKTDVPKGFQVIKITEADGSTNSGWLSTDKMIGDYYGTGEVETPVNIIVTENDGSSARTGYIYIKAGRLEAKLTVTQGVDEKRSEVFEFIEYINVNGTGTVVPVTGGTITAKVNTNMGWTLRTSINGVETSMSLPESTVAANYQLSVQLPAISNPMVPVNTKVWIEYKGVALQEVTYTQGYNFTATATEVTSKNGGNSVVTITGERPLLHVRAITGTTTLDNNTVAAGSSAVAGTANLAISATTVTRDITIQWSLDGSTGWTDIITFTQSTSIAAQFARSNIVWDETNQRLTFATTPEENALIPANSQGVFFQWGSLVAISPATLSGTDVTYKAGKYPDGHIVYSSTGTYTYAWTSIPYFSESGGLLENNRAEDDDFATYNEGTGFNTTEGKGDICRYITSKGWVRGRWRMPTCHEYEQFPVLDFISHDDARNENAIVCPESPMNNHFGWSEPNAGVWLIDAETSPGIDDESTRTRVYLPAGGARDEYGNAYWYRWMTLVASSSDSGDLRTAYFAHVGYDRYTSMSGSKRRMGAPVRCIRE